MQKQDKSVEECCLESAPQAIANVAFLAYVNLGLLITNYFNIVAIQILVLHG